MKFFRFNFRERGKKPDALVSFPKSGRTWLRVMLDQLGVDIKHTHAGSRHKVGRHLSSLNTSTSLKYKRILFLHRDPRDTVVSGYHQKQSRLDGFNGTISDFIRSPNHGIEKIIHFNQMWCQLAETRDQMLVTTYEELRAETNEVLRTITEFLGVDVTPQEIAKTVESCRFENMKKKAQSGYYEKNYGGGLSERVPGDANSAKVRKGKVGGYREELSEEDVAFCDELVAKSGMYPPRY